MILRTTRVLCLLCLATIMSACFPTVNMKPTDSLLSPTGDKALVRFMRPSTGSSGILDGDKVIGQTSPKSQFDYLADPGRHVFITSSGTQFDYMEAELEAGKTYYVITRYADAFVQLVFFSAVTRDSEYWEKVKEYEVTLKKLQPDAQKWDKHNHKYKSELQKILHKYETELKGTRDWQRLRPEDGR